MTGSRRARTCSMNLGTTLTRSVSEGLSAILTRSVSEDPYLPRARRAPESQMLF